MKEIEEIVKRVFKIDSLDDKHLRITSMARIIFIHEIVRRKIKTIDDLLSEGRFTKGQINHAIYEFKYKLRVNFYFKSLYLNVLEQELNEKYRTILFR